MKRAVSRRSFLKSSAVAAASTATVLSFEEKALLAAGSSKPAPAPASQGTLPTAKIRNVSISRLICGGNLVSGFAHSRDLIYVSSVLKAYFTDEKILETWALCEACGVNTAILRLDEVTIRLLKTYWKERGGKLQWLAQVDVRNDADTAIKMAVDNGAVGAFTHGNVGDDYVTDGKVELLGEAVQKIKAHGVIAGVAGHMLEVVKACEKAGVKPDFYMKTFNSKRYWSAGPMPRHDSVWEETPQETMEFMANLETPWIAYKVLGAGAIHPREGFRYAFFNGADMLCVGMFDFQVKEDAALAAQSVERAMGRPRPWRA